MVQQPSHATCLLFVGASRRPCFVVERCRVPPLKELEALMRVSLAGLCADDLHRFHDDHHASSTGCALIPGHEAVGVVIASRRPGVDVGARVVISAFNWCSACEWCRRGAHVACENVTKYGHPPLAAPSEGGALGGALSSLMVVRGGSAVCVVPPAVPDRHALLASCPLPTALAAVLRITAGLPRPWQGAEGPSALVQGCGLVGILACAALSESGFRVFCEDDNATRVRLAAKFRALPVFKDSGPLSPPPALPKQLDAVVVAFGSGVSGRGQRSTQHAAVRPNACRQLRPGGTLLLLGHHGKGTEAANLDVGAVLEKGLCVIGASSYEPANLRDAVEFLEATCDKFPYDELLSPAYAMDNFQSALASALDRRFLRVLVRPC